MQHSDNNDVQVQSTATLIKASVIAIVIGILVLVVAILPAEYNIDPTGLGSAMGLTSIAQAENQISLTTEPANTANAQIVILNAPSVAVIQQARENSAVRSDTVNVLIPAGKGLEYKLLLNQFTHLEYEWQTLNDELLYFDFHGEPQGDTTDYYESYNISTASKVTGSLTTPFAGSHGWYWKNTSNYAVTVVLTTKGEYLIKG
ncbi:hypothetical protein J8L86_16070 [Shewanella sp. MMG014]|uniref:hypothetical protein n=1 Tax=Shewanella sp. MMG014 TaxID=2822691 RepID=UPI001B37189B|nr:hypothetical protein [Shewanella sp. MMG014]MBQ4891372.1 hypothetical protein [Shewanella sp. MMG014]